MPADPQPSLRPASTVLLLRDGADGLEVFMVERHREIESFSGALVFPGGKVDPGDGDPTLRGHVTGADGLGDGALAFRVAAIREAFEEVGVLLARAEPGGPLIEGQRLADLDRRYRKPLELDEVTMADLADAESLQFAVDLLVPFAHWITPDIVPKRFDTHFFLGPATPEQLAGIAGHDGREAVDSVWVRPRDALAEADAGRRTLVFATRMNLEKLGRSDTVAEALTAARASTIVTVTPEVTLTDTGRTLRIPAEADYGLTEMAIPEG